jgi:large subunit ribosomal protein L9
MQVLLIKDVKNHGRAGEVKEVKDGYGEFLIKNNQAKLATNAVMKQFAAKEKERKAHEAGELAAILELAKKLEGVTIKIAKKVGANGSLFGAIKKEEIAEGLAKLNLVVDKRDLEIDGAIKGAGVYEIGAKLGKGIHPKFRLEVIAE